MAGQIGDDDEQRQPLRPDEPLLPGEGDIAGADRGDGGDGQKHQERPQQGGSGPHDTPLDGARQTPQKHGDTTEQVEEGSLAEEVVRQPR